METTLKNEETVLSVMARMYKQFEKCAEEDKLERVQEMCKDELEFLCRYFEINDTVRCLVISLLVIRTLEAESFSLEDLKNFLHIRDICVWTEYISLFHQLVEEGILHTAYGEEDHSAFLRREYLINPNLIQIILENKSFSEYTTKRTLCFTDVLKLLEYIYEKRDSWFDANRFYRRKYLSGTHTSNEIIRRFSKVIDEHTHLPYIKFIKHVLSENVYDLYVYLNFVWYYIMWEEAISLKDIIKEITKFNADGVRYVMEIGSGEHIFIKESLLKEDETDSFFSFSSKEWDRRYILSDKSIEWLYEYQVIPRIKKNRKKAITRARIILPSEIQYVKLWYSEKTEEMITYIQQCLCEDTVRHIQNEFSLIGMTPCISVLLYGPPGTGKTETVKQLARATNREIIQVDMSQIKNKYFGESEKNVQKIFKEYQQYANACEQWPILLFNEADALFSKRKDPFFSSVAQTENTIQNILLEALESFEGILFATSNLLTNLDPAFERRFLFKVEFTKPSEEVRLQLWKSMFSFLPEYDCTELASKYEFSGGQINNILRKCIFYKILEGKEPSYYLIEKFCDEEHWNTNTDI